MALPVVIDEAAQTEHKLGLLLPPKGFKTKCKSFGDIPGVMLTMDEIKNIIVKRKRPPRRETFGNSWILDQSQHGSCAGYMEAGAYGKTRWLKGVQDGMTFAGSYNYSFCNGGSDNGSMLDDEMNSGVKNGHISTTKCTWQMIYRNQTQQFDAEAATHKSEEPWAISTLEELYSALALDFICGVAVDVGNNFMRLDGDGFPGASGGPGNHAVHVDDVVLINGKLAADMANSWNLVFGVQGRCYLDERHFRNTIGQHGFYAIGSSIEIGDKVPPIA